MLPFCIYIVEVIALEVKATNILKIITQITNSVKQKIVHQFPTEVFLAVIRRCNVIYFVDFCNTVHNQIQSRFKFQIPSSVRVWMKANTLSLATMPTSFP